MQSAENLQPRRVPELPAAEALFEHLADAVYLIDPDSSNIVWCNRKGWESLGLCREDVLNHSVLSLQKDVHGLPQWSEIASAIFAMDCFRFVGRHRHADGHEIEVEVNTTHFLHAGRRYFLSVARDITNRVAQGVDAPGREKQLWFALNEASDGLWDWNVTTGALFFSPQLKRMLGYGPDEMTPVLETWSQNLHPDDALRVKTSLEAHLQGRKRRFEAEYRIRNRNGHYLWVHDRGRVCEHDADGHPSRVVGMVQDISERKQLELQLQELASSDPLTGLGNRREGMRFLELQRELCLRMGISLGLAYIDIDHFKQVNDKYGHPAGDQVIRRVGYIIKQTLRGSDVLCRWGGEEFLVIAPHTELEQITLLAEKLRQAVLVATLEDTVPVTISVGVAAGQGRRLDIAQLIADADAALYRAKGKGRNRVEWTPSRDA